MNVSKIDKTSRKIPWLAGLFAAQVVLAVLLFNVQSREPAGLNEPLLALDSNAIDRIEVSDGGKPVTDVTPEIISTLSDRWSLTDQNEFGLLVASLPVVGSGIEDRLGKG